MRFKRYRRKPSKSKRSSLSTRSKLKKETFKWMSRYVRLRDAIEYTKIQPDAANEYALCCSCGTIKHVLKADAGHCIGRGSGGQSGVYFDERNVHLQCKICNGFEAQSVTPAYREFIDKKYGDGTIKELDILHKVRSYSNEKIIGLGIYYKQEYEKQCELISKRLWKN